MHLQWENIRFNSNIVEMRWKPWFRWTPKAYKETQFCCAPPVALPRRVIAAHILLPYFSPGGKYVVSVTTDRNDSATKAEGQGTANLNGFHADLSVTLDLRRLPQRTYYLATTHEGDKASYYYPLTLR